MELHFLKAEDPLTKQFTRLDDGTYDKKPYPFATLVNSTAIEVETPQGFFIALKGAAEMAACLMKGELDRTLVNESRASKTLSSKATEWVVFDIDDMQGVKDAEEFIHEILPTPFQNVSYISQLSCSSGITGTGLRLHLFFLLANAVPPDTIKAWVTETNFDTPILRDQLKLAAGGMALRYPLDRSVADNSKLIFIAPPICTNFDDPLADQRIILHAKEVERVPFDFHSSPVEVIRQKEKDIIEALRDSAGLEKRKYRTIKEGDIEILKDADPVTVTDWWEGNGFIHLNLDGGDSGAYWVNPKRPRLIQNFKGEPCLLLRDVAGDFWEEIREICGVEDMLIYRDQEADKYWTAKYDPVVDTILWEAVTKKEGIKGWAEFHFGAAVPDPMPQYSRVFDPTNPKVVDKANGIVNEFQPTEYMRLTKPDKLPALGYLTERILCSVTGDDDEVLKYFINWLAFIFQTGKKTQVAIVLHGVPGTGKGLLQNHLLRPLFGKYTTSIQLDQLERDLFTGFLARNLIIQIDEAQANEKMRNKIFGWITEEYIEVRRAYAEAKQVQTFCNFIFASNHLDAVKIEALDRRFVVAPRQERPIEITPDEVQRELPKEVNTFARYLLAWKVNIEQATRPLVTAAKEQMRLDSQTSVERFVEAIASGNICYFLEALSAGAARHIGTGADDVVKKWAQNVNSGEESVVWQTDMALAYRYISQKEQSAEAFGIMITKHGVAKRYLIGPSNDRRRGLYIKWTADPAELQAYKDLLGAAGVRAEALDPLEKVVAMRGTNEKDHSR